MANVFNLEGRMGLNTTAFKSGITEAGRNLNSFTARSNLATRKIKKSFSGISGAIAGVSKALSIGGALSFAGLAALSNEAIGTAKEIQKLANVTGSTVEEIQALNFAFIESEMSASDVNKTLGKISVAVSGAKNGVATYVDSFAMIGITADELKGKRPAEVFSMIADAAAKTEDPVQRFAAVSGILGAKLAQKLVPALMEGSNSFAAMARRAKEAGVIMEAGTVQGAVNAAEAMDKLNTVIGGGTTKTFALLGPYIEFAAEKLRELISDSVSFEEAFRTSFGGAIKTIGILGDGFHAISILLSTVEVAALRFTTTFSGAIAGLLAVVADFGNAIKDFITFPLRQVLELASKIPGEVGESMKKALSTIEDFKLRPPTIVVDVFASQIQALEMAKDELDKKLMEKIPSEALSDWSKDMDKSIAKMKEASAAAEKLRLAKAASGIAITDIDNEKSGASKPSAVKSERVKKSADTSDKIRKQEDKLAAQMLKAEEKNIANMEKLRARAADKERLDRIKLQRQMAEDAEAFNSEISYTLGGEVSSILDGNFKDIGSGFSAMLKDMAAQAITADILGALGMGAKGGGTAPGSFFGGAMNFLGGFFADGGRPPVNKVSVVGERGPELFIPGQQGTIIPNSALGSGGEGKKVVNNFNITTPDANSFRSSRSRIASDISRVVR